MIVEHIKKPIYRKIDKNVKEKLDEAMEAFVGTPHGDAIKHILKNAVDQEYLATLIAFIPEETNTVLVGYAQCIRTRVIAVINDLGEEEAAILPGDFFTRRQGIETAVARAVKFAKKNAKNNVFLPGESAFEVKKEYW